MQINCFGYGGGGGGGSGRRGEVSCDTSYLQNSAVLGI